MAFYLCPINNHKTLCYARQFKKHRKTDDSRINVHQDHEVTYWTKELGVTAERLKDAVKAVGPLVKDVKKYLGK